MGINSENSVLCKGCSDDANLQLVPLHNCRERVHDSLTHFENCILNCQCMLGFCSSFIKQGKLNLEQAFISEIESKIQNEVSAFVDKYSSNVFEHENPVHGKIPSDIIISNGLVVLVKAHIFILDILTKINRLQVIEEEFSSYGRLGTYSVI